MAGTKKCKHPACSCKVQSGEDYCSTQCAAMEDTPDVSCKCGHADCRGNIADAKTAGV